MKRIYLVYYNFLNSDKKTLSIGGIQTYLLNLCGIIIKCGFQPVLFQLSDESFVVDYDGIIVHGIASKKSKFSKTAVNLVPKNELLIFGTHELIVPYDGSSIAIQHGITWDVPVHRELSNSLSNLYIFQRARMGYRLLRLLSNVQTLVCVDYNFVNWYRTQVAYSNRKMVTIPNFTEIAPVVYKNDDVVRIIFARRLFWYRGTRIFADVVKKLWIKYGDRVYITIAGSGEDEEFLRKELFDCNNVEFVKYKSCESISVHTDKHIAVVPTIGSEGTSLSLLEAMSSQCAVICSNVGGMTNIVIDNFNGLLVDSGDTSELFDAIVKLVDNKLLRIELSNNAYLTVKKAFSYEQWEEKWTVLLNDMMI